MLHGSAPDGLVAIAEAPVLVALVLKDVRVDCPDPNAALGGMIEHLRVGTVREVPQHVDRHRRTDAGVLVDLAGVFELLEDGARRRRLMELAEARTGVGVAPRGGLDAERSQSVQKLLAVASSLADLVEQALRLVTVAF